MLHTLIATIDTVFFTLTRYVLTLSSVRYSALMKKLNVGSNYLFESIVTSFNQVWHHFISWSTLLDYLYLHIVSLLSALSNYTVYGFFIVCREAFLKIVGIANKEGPKSGFSVSSPPSGPIRPYPVAFTALNCTSRLSFVFFTSCPAMHLFYYRFYLIFIQPFMRLNKSPN